MLRCSEKAYAQCPDRHLCGPIEDATFTEDSECAAFNQTVEEKPMTKAEGGLTTEYHKAPEFGKRFILPGEVQMDCSTPTLQVTSKIASMMAEQYDSFLVEQILTEAKWAGISDITVLNKSAILEALQKSVPMEVEESSSDGKCPRCCTAIEHRNLYCHNCGQALKWKVN